MRKIILLCLLLVQVQIIIAQDLINISGKVIDIETEKPLPFASVFFNNTTYGAMTEEDGKFHFETTPGTYDLIVNFFSYKPIIFQITVDSTFDKTYLLKMSPLQYDLKEVSVESTRDEAWYQNFEVFKENFIGTSINAGNCEILNPEVLIIDYNYRKNTLDVKARDALIIENRALGYQLHYLLENYHHDFSSGYVSFLGYPRFQNITGKKGKMKKWNKQRKRAYYGSQTHFFKSILKGTLEEEGYEVIEVIKKPNPNRPTDEELKKARSKLRAASNNGFSLTQDSPERITLSKASEPRFINYTNNKLLSRDDFSRAEANKRIISFDNYLQVTYTKENAELAFTRKTDKVPQTTMLSLINGQTEIFSNGLLQDPLTMLYNGYMGWEKIADMLPLDYKISEDNQ